MQAERARSEAIMIRRRSKRSTTTPPSGPSTTNGTIRAAVAIPAQVEEPVRSYTTASRARLYSQSPAWETARAASRRRKRG
jgi:hypothetical protein